jgi:hypothetical protein
LLERDANTVRTLRDPAAGYRLLCISSTNSPIHEPSVGAELDSGAASGTWKIKLRRAIDGHPRRVFFERVIPFLKDLWRQVRQRIAPENEVLAHPNGAPGRLAFTPRLQVYRQRFLLRNR